MHSLQLVITPSYGICLYNLQGQKLPPVSKYMSCSRAIDVKHFISYFTSLQFNTVNEIQLYICYKFYMKFNCIKTIYTFNFT